MVGENKQKRNKLYFIAGGMGLIFIGCLVILSFIQYSDGDDSFFLQYCGSMGFLEYLTWRYETWTGRMISEGFMHLFFNQDLWVWRIVNAGMITALPISLAFIKKKITGSIEIVDFWFAVLFYLLIDIKTFGYSCIWITGSMNYLWPAVCGVMALLTVAAEGFQIEDEGLIEKKDHRKNRFYAVSIPCAMIAGMSSEQMGAVIFAFSMICIGSKLWQKKKVGIGMLLQAVATAGAFGFSSLAPGNALRVAASVEIYMPQFNSLSLSERLFLLIQWLISSFANENAMLFVAIWFAGVFLLWDRLKRERFTSGKKLWIKGCLSGCIIFAVIALLGKAGVKAVCDVGIDLSKLTGKVETVPTATDMTMIQWFVLLWWSLALVFTFFLLWELTNGNIVILLTYLGAIACEVILIFSPTIYSSGERVFFVTGILLMGILLLLLDMLQKEKLETWYIGSVTGLAVVNLLLQIPKLISMFVD